MLGFAENPTRRHIFERYEHCCSRLRSGAQGAVTETLARIGDKWTVMVVGTLHQGPMR